MKADKGRVSFKLKGSAAAIVCLPAQARLVKSALRPLLRLPLQEIVLVVLGNASPEISAIADVFPNVRTIFLPNEQDAWRGMAAGAGTVDADVVLFADGMKPGKAARLTSFLRACRRGADVALNDITPRLGTFNRWRRGDRMAAFLNMALNRRDLGVSTLQCLPFAIARRALTELGAETLASPLRAHAAAIRRGLRVKTGGYVPPSAAARNLMAGKADAIPYADVWREALQQADHRLSYPDTIRKRSVLTEGLES